MNSEGVNKPGYRGAARLCRDVPSAGGFGGRPEPPMNSQCCRRRIWRYAAGAKMSTPAILVP